MNAHRMSEPMLSLGPWESWESCYQGYIHRCIQCARQPISTCRQGSNFEAAGDVPGPSGVMTDYVSVCLLPVHFITSFLWAPPAATQFFLWFGHRQWRLLSVRFISSLHFSGRRLWRLSFLVCHTVSCMFGHHQWQLLCVI